MSELTVDGLTRALETLTDRQRIDFAVWARDQPNPTSARLDWGRPYLEVMAVVDEAVRAFDRLRHDETVSDTEGEWFFDPAFPDGWAASPACQARAAVSCCASARAIARTCVSSLAAAFERIGLPVDDQVNFPIPGSAR